MINKKIVTAIIVSVIMMFGIQGCFEKPKADPVITAITPLDWVNDNTLNGKLIIKLPNSIGAKLKTYHIDYYDNVDSAKITEFERKPEANLEPNAETELEIILIEKDTVFEKIKYLKTIYCTMTVVIEDNNGNTYQLKKQIKIDRSSQIKSIEVKTIKISEKGEESDFKGGYVITKDLKPKINITFTEGITLDNISDKTILIERKLAANETGTAKTTSISIYASGTANTLAIALNNDLTTNSSFRLTIKGTPSGGIRGTKGEILDTDYILEFEVRLSSESNVTYMDISNAVIVENAIDDENSVEHTLNGSILTNSLKATVKIDVTSPISNVIYDMTKLKENIKLIDLNDSNKEVSILPVLSTSQQMRIGIVGSLKDEHSYELTVLNGIVGKAGEVFKENKYTYSFSVRLNKFKVLSSTPISGGTATEIINKAEIKFNHAVNSESISTNQAIVVTENGVDISGNTTVQCTDDKTVEISWQFKNEKDYKIIVQGVTDIFENTVVTKEINFSTVKIESTTTAAVYLELASAKIRENVSSPESYDLDGYLIENNLKPEITVVFSLNTDKKTITTGSIKLQNIFNNSVIAITTPAAFANKIIITPAEKLTDDTIYRITIDSSIKGENGEELKKAYIEEFRTKIIPIKIQDTTFFNNAGSTDITNYFGIKFNKEINMEAASTNMANNVKITENGVDISSNVKMSFDSKASIYTEWPFKEKTTYVVNVKNIEDLYGNKIEEKSYTFTTKQTDTGITTSAVYIDVSYSKIKENPASIDQSELSAYVIKNNLMPEIEIGFSANTDKSTVTFGAFILEDITNISAVLPVVINNPVGYAEKVIIKPSSKLIDGHVYRLRVTKLVKGSEKEEMRREYSVEFRTGVEYEKIETTSPISNSSGIETLDKVSITFANKLKKDSVSIGTATTASISVLENGADISNLVTQIISEDLKTIEIRYSYKEGKKYKVVVKKATTTQNGVTDEYGNGLAVEDSVNFEMKSGVITSAAVFLEVGTISIREKDTLSDANGYILKENLKPEIGVVFSGNTDKTTVTAGAVFIEDITNINSPVKVTLDKLAVFADKLYLTPSANLIDGHIYKVRITTQVKGENKEELRKEYSAEFKVSVNYLKIDSSLPVGNSTGIETLTSVEVNFSKELNKEFVKLGIATTASIGIYENGVDISQQTTVEISDSLTKITLKALFQNGKKYDIIFKDNKTGQLGIVDKFGNGLQSEATLTFTMKTITTQATNMEPIVATINEKGTYEELGQGYKITNNLLPKIEIGFTNGVILDKSTMSSSTVILEDITTTVAVTVAIVTPATISVANKLAIVPVAKLMDNHSYRIRIVKGILGSNGEILKENEYKYEFSTGINYPKIDKSLPLGGSTGLELLHKAVITLNKEINTTTVTGSTVAITETDIDTGVSLQVQDVSYSFDETLKIVTFGWIFNKGKEYTLTFNGIEDLFGNKMESNTIKFRTYRETQSITVPIPLNLNAVSGVNSVTLTWEKPESTDFNIVGYNIYIGTDKDNLYKLKNGKTPNLEFATSIIIHSGDVYNDGTQDVTIATGNTYYFKVTGVTEGNLESSRGNIVSAYVYNGSAPVLLQNEINTNMGLYYNALTTTSVAGIKMEWKNKTVASYVIYKSTTLATGPFVKIIEVAENSGGSTTTYIDTVIPGIQVWYRIGCKTAQGEGVQSGAVTAKDEDSPTTPPATDPYTLEAFGNNGYTMNGDGSTTPTGDKKIYVSWAANAERDLAGYKVYMSDKSDGEYILMKKTAYNGSVSINPLARDSSVGGGATGYYNSTGGIGDYFIRVTAYDQVGNESLQSRYITVRNNALTLQPSLSGVSAPLTVDITAKPPTTQASITLSWDNPNAVGNKAVCEIYRSDSGSSFVLIAAVDATTTSSYQDNLVVDGKIYKYEIIVVDEYKNTSNASNQVTVPVP